eukprot:scaffold7485_cov176-Amphora_coffeaeformis.AAC.10
MSTPCQLFLLFLWIATTPWVARAWYIASPASQSDWEQLAKLLAERNQPRSADSRVAKLQWDVWGRRQVQDALYRRYVQTARQLKGSKYAVFLAKEWGQVIGVAEMGIGDGGGGGGSDATERRAILGVLCVSPTARRQGIGAALVQRCEEVATQIWQEETLWVEVETTNSQALRFFESCGYIDTEQRSMVAVQRRQVLEETPHVVLAKPLIAHKDSVVEQEQA